MDRNVANTSEAFSTKFSNYTAELPNLNINEQGPVVVFTKTDVKCFGDNSGSIELTITGAAGTVSYLWDDGSTSQNRANLAAGTYSVSVTDSNGTTVEIVTISQPSSILTATLTGQTNVSCFGQSDGAVEITPAGGTAPYVITPNQTGLAAGNHTLTVTDANGCFTTVNATITQPAAALTATLTSQNNVLCFGLSTGSAVITPAGGTAPYVITPAQTRLTAGIHTFTITDAGNCSTTVDVTITQPAAALIASVSSQVNVLCFGQSTGIANIAPSGGTPPYTITPVQTGLAAGVHTFTVTDANGCTATTNVTITQPASSLTATLISQVNVSCFSQSTGAVVISPSGGTAPYSVTPTQTALAAGLYTFTVTDSNGCTATVNTTITQPAAALSASVTSQTNVFCFGQSTGSATITATGGTAPYVITPAQTGLAAGLHTFTVTDALGCTTPVSLTITQPSATITFNAPAITNASCSGRNDGVIITGASGGTGTINYSISPNIGSQSPSGKFNNLTAQTYVITATDQNGCSQTTSVTVGTIPDVTPPVISGSPANISLFTGAASILCSQTATWTEPTAVDNCAGAMTFTTRSNAPGSVFPVGTTTVTYTFKDASNNTSTCTFNVIVTDNTPPTFTAPNPISIFSDASGNYNAAPAITGQPANLGDNCSLGVNQPTYTDGPRVFAACNGTSTVIRTWSLKDVNGNTTTFGQTITITDNQPPVLTIPPTANIECNVSTLPATTGQATATDNSGATITPTYTDVTVNGNCSGRSTISRTWRAADCSGNTVSAIQTINIQDTQAPILTCASFSVPNPDAIPASYLNTNISATDNCGGPIEILLISEVYAGLAGAPGFCPTSVTRKYIAKDNCGNTSAECTQIITVTSTAGCAKCQSTVPFFPVILTGRPDSLWKSPSVVRNDICCGVTGPPPPRCISFNVYLDKDAVGLVFTIPTGAKPGGALYYQIDCEPDKKKVGDVICLAGDRFYLLTFCEPGNNPNTYAIQSISGITGQSGLVTRADANCAGQLSYKGADPNSVVWSVKSPNDQTLLRYLSCTHCENPIFTPDALCPPEIIYKVCGTLLGTNMCGNTPMTDCKEVTVTVLAPININFDINPGDVCANNIPTIHAGVTPTNQYYTYEWFNAPNGTGTILSTAENWTPTAEGSYSLVVKETQSGIKCNVATHNFDIHFDVTGPIITAPSAPLTIECNDANAPQKIATWLSTAKATDGLISVPVTNNYNGITMACGTVLPVIFTALDACGNPTTVTFPINVVDTTSPVIACPADVSVFADNGQCYATGVALGTPVATDNCNTPSVTNNAPSQYPVGTTMVTWTATDACGNVAHCTQRVTVIDNQPPILTCPDPVTATATAPLCVIPAIVITPLGETDNCGIASTTWKKTGVSTASGSGDVNGTSFNVGVTTVTYTVTDIHGNIAHCSFLVTVRDQVPPTIITCPPNVTRNVDPNSCTATIVVPAPVVVDPCGEIVSWTNSFNNTTDASGTYPGGITLVTWTFTDESGNISTCIQTINIIDNIPPTISCPANVVQTALPNDCALNNVVIPNPVIADNCPVILTWVMSGATTGTSPATGLNYVGGLTFNVGITQVTYTVTDISGNTATCSFTVWIKSLFKPIFSVGCPADIIQDTDAGKCDAAVTVPVPLVSDPCNELVSIVNSFNNTSNASGTYPIGTTLVTWTITNVSGNITTCVQKVTVNDLLPTLTCPPSIIVNSDFNQTFATNVAIGIPVYADNCPGLTLTWVSSNPTPGTSNLTGINIDNVSTYNAGVTTITYTLKDANNNIVTCFFTVTVLERPVITCIPDITRNTDPGLCSAIFDPGAPTLVSGALPVTWTWQMTGATTGNGTGNPISPIPYLFNVGVTSITWTATNGSGQAICTQIITVIDNEPPTFIANPQSFCVEYIFSATYLSNALKINPDPDYYLFRKGTTLLDLDINSFNDNCCAGNTLVINWRIDFADTPNQIPPPAVLTHPSITGTGQPSAYPTDIQMPGDGVTFRSIIHTITYWLVDCNGNRSTDRVVNITIKPRPQVKLVTK